MIEKLKSPEEKKLEYKAWLESLPEKERKENEDADRIADENDLKRKKEETESQRLEEEFSKIIIKDAVEQNICYEYSSCLELPKEAAILLPYSFYKCNRIESAYVHDNIRICTKETFHETDDILMTNPVYKKENGLMINTHLGILLYSDDDLENIIVPEGVVEIAPYAFNGCAMKSIKLPESLKKIGPYCFNYCSNLETITIPKGIKEINRNCFNFCANLKEIPKSK